jgi:hypothetical protein
MLICACAEPQAGPAAPATPAHPSAPADADVAAIRQTALDYIEGWYTGDGDRMARALHPELAKRIVRTENGASRLSHMSAAELTQGTRNGGGKDTPAERQFKEVTVFDVYGGAATAKIVASDWIDYLHLSRVDGRWVIVNVLWELNPR